MKRRFGTGTLILALGLVTLSFVAATFLVHLLLTRMDEAASDIAENASPSIEHLAAVRGEIGQVQARLDALLDARALDEPLSTSELEGSRSAVRQELAAYFALPVFPEERAYWVEFQLLSLSFDRSVDRVLGAITRGELGTARFIQRHEVDGTAEALGQGAAKLIDMNARHGHDRARDMLLLRQRAQSLAAALTTSCVALSVVAFAFVQREARRDRTLEEENMRLLAARADELENFAGRVAHDVLSPLSSVKLALSIIARSQVYKNDPVISANVVRADRGLSRATKVVHALLTFASAGARPEHGTSADVVQCAEGILEDLRADAESERVALELEVRCQQHARVSCSEGVLVSVLSNLARNALKHMGDSPHRRVVVRVEESGDRGDRVRVEVADTGPGIPTELLDRIFEPFFRIPGSTQPGIGLGLATVRRLVESHGGSVGVRSKPGDGSVFWFTLPREHEAEREATSTQRPVGAA